MKMFKLATMVLSTGALSMSMITSVDAALLSTDWLNANDNLVVTDTDSSLDWLKLTETVGYSYTSVASQLGTGDQFDGWRYATNLEVASLFTVFGLLLDAHLTVTGPVDTSIVNFANTMGNIMNDANPIFSYGARGYIGESYGGDMYQAGAYYVTSSLSNIYVGPNLGAGASLSSPAIARLDLGSYLVRDASINAVPVPAAVWLFGSGLIGLIGLARRKTA